MKMKTVEKNNQNIIYFENNNTTAQTVWSSFDQSWLKMLNLYCISV